MPLRETFRGLAIAAMTLVLVACVDATHDEQVQALGGEAPGVRTGPEHRPGQPCLVCHGGLGPGRTTFGVAGTVYAVELQPAPAVGAQVQVEDINGTAYLLPTNSAGNFYIAASQWQPVFPTKMQVTYEGVTARMMTAAGRNGSCADCHQATVGPNSPGPIYAAATLSALHLDGGTE